MCLGPKLATIFLFLYFKFETLQILLIYLIWKIILWKIINIFLHFLCFKQFLNISFERRFNCRFKRCSFIISWSLSCGFGWDFPLLMTLYCWPTTMCVLIDVAWRLCGNCIVDISDFRFKCILQGFFDFFTHLFLHLTNSYIKIILWTSSWNWKTITCIYICKTVIFLTNSGLTPMRSLINTAFFHFVISKDWLIQFTGFRTQ